MQELLDQIKVVAQARLNAKLQKDLIAELRADWERVYRDVLDAGPMLSSEVAVQEETLRTLTLKAYEADPNNKAPAPGVGIKEVTTYTYDPAIALKWAVEHDMALKLDDTAFKKIVKALTVPLPFVTSITAPIATIATVLEVETNAKDL